VADDRVSVGFRVRQSRGLADGVEFRVFINSSRRRRSRSGRGGEGEASYLDSRKNLSSPKYVRVVRTLNVLNVRVPSDGRTARQ